MQRGLLNSVQDCGVDSFVGDAQIHQRIDALLLGKDRQADLAGYSFRLVLFVDGIVKNDHVVILVDDFVIGDEFLPLFADLSANLAACLKRRLV